MFNTTIVVMFGIFCAAVYLISRLMVHALLKQQALHEMEFVMEHDPPDTAKPLSDDDLEKIYWHVLNSYSFWWQILDWRATHMNAMFPNLINKLELAVNLKMHEEETIE